MLACARASCSSIRSTDWLHTSGFSVCAAFGADARDERDVANVCAVCAVCAVCIACAVCAESTVCFCGMGIGGWLNSAASSSSVGFELSAGFSTRAGLNVETVETVETLGGVGVVEAVERGGWREERWGER